MIQNACWSTSFHTYILVSQKEEEKDNCTCVHSILFKNIFSYFLLTITLSLCYV